MSYKTTSQQQTQAFAEAIGGRLVAGDVVLLIGDIGMGKSVIARAAAGALGVRCAMPSPTFTIMQPYKGDVNVYHYDLYRLCDLDEFYQAGLDEFIGANGVAFIEWPIEGMDIEGPVITVSLRRGEGFDERVIDVTVRGMDSRRTEILKAISGWEVKDDSSGC